MDRNIGLLFRPTLIICVGKAGELIREHLNPHYARAHRRLKDDDHPLSVYHLLNSVDKPLQQSIGLLQVVTEGPGANPQVAIPFPISKDFLANDPDVPTEQLDTNKMQLEDMIYRALVSVQLDRRVLDIKSQGYKISNTRTQVFIVGEPTDENMPWMAKILSIVQKLVQSHGFETPVCYFLNSYSSGKDYLATLKKPLGGAIKWADYHLANLTYLYEHMMPYPSPTYLSQDEIRYATAETLLALAATGITSSDFDRDEMRIPLDLEDYANHVGSFSTSMIQFPRPSVRSYSGAKLSSELIQEWYDLLNKAQVSDDERRDMKNQARHFVGGMVAWMKDQEERPGAEKSLWPSLEILRRGNHPGSNRQMQMQKDALDQLVDRSQRLFDVFDDRDVFEEWRLQKSNSWGDVTAGRSGRAVGLYAKWESQAKEVWETATGRACDEVKRDVDALWPKVPNGFEAARIYVDELDDRLADLVNEIDIWRQGHYANYKNERERFLRLSEDGEWILGNNQSNIQGPNPPGTPPPPQQAKPRMGPGGGGIGPGGGGQNVNFGAAILGAGGGGVVGGGGGRGGGGLPELEESIALNLARRADWKKGLIPPVGSLGTVSLLGCLAAAYTAGIFGLPLTSSLIVDGAGALAFALGSLFLYVRRFREFREAQGETLNFYRLYYTHCCEYREDLQRISLMRMLQQRVQRMRDRLDNMGAFLKRTKTAMDAQATETSYRLFKGPGGVRDIFIANGERLQSAGVHTLDSVTRKITDARLNHPLENWHQTLDEMKGELIKRLQQQSAESLMEMHESRVQEYLHDFTAEVVEGYLTGTLVNISAALDKPDVWREILERVRRPIYSARTGLRDPQLTFVCGSATDLNKSSPYLPNDAICVQTKSSEWLMVATFFRGGEPKVVDADKLFPIK